MTDDPAQSFDILTTQLLEDPDDDVALTSRGLHVHGKLFAFLDDGDLVVDLPQGRAADLVERGIAAPASDPVVAPKGAWVRIGDPEDWPELASESHQFVGEPAVGRES
ncbi:hypothetical protein [Leifsonia sp. NPDC058230]|uniref:hypothetical protein n=1 Tax=Leifsonia sp. NPDC058230 TaxID=3346391 RepID=UPI0036D97755